MAEWQIYWADFPRQREKNWPTGSEKPFDWWRTNNPRLKDNLCKGDRLWFFTSGKLCGYDSEPEVHQGYLVQLLRVESCDHNPDFDRGRRPDPVENPRYQLWVQDKGCLAISPPLLVEDIIFPDKRDFPPMSGQSVGEKLQTPRKIEGHKLRALKARLRAAGFGEL